MGRVLSRKALTVPRRRSGRSQPSAEIRPRVASGAASATATTRSIRRVLALEREHAGREQLARLPLLLELGERDLPAGLARDAQPVDVRLDPLVEPGEMAQRVVRRVDGGVAQQPEERRLLGVLLDDDADDARADTGGMRGLRLSSAAPSRP